MSRSNTMSSAKNKTFGLFGARRPLSAVPALLVLAFFTLAAGLTPAMGASPALAQHDHGAAHGSPEPEMIYSTTGVIVELDPANSRLVADHEAIPQVGWGPMVMGFRVAGPDLLDGLAVGDRVRLDISFRGQTYLVVDVEKL
ncbi:MAG: copper-binding protein [Deltaproteobacteria bacterium]|jgi:Cu(I)/Ag(I) efflux system protein CusF|nr:copper-binding protein [Deltaproteobacteria bacterium]